MEIQVHAPELVDEPSQTVGSVGRRDVYPLTAHYAVVAPHHGFQSVDPPAGDADLPSTLRQELGHFHADARRGTHHYCFPCHHGSLCLSLWAKVR